MNLDVDLKWVWLALGAMLAIGVWMSSVGY
jgi:hypothetical protein